MNYKLLEVDYDLSWSSSYKKLYAFVGENKVYKLKLNITNEGETVDFKGKHLSVVYKLPNKEDTMEFVHFMPEHDTVTVDLIDEVNQEVGTVHIEVAVKDLVEGYVYTCPLDIKINVKE